MALHDEAFNILNDDLGDLENTVEAMKADFDRLETQQIHLAENMVALQQTVAEQYDLTDSRDSDVEFARRLHRAQLITAAGGAYDFITLMDWVNTGMSGTIFDDDAFFPHIEFDQYEDDEDDRIDSFEDEDYDEWDNQDEEYEGFEWDDFGHDTPLTLDYPTYCLTADFIGGVVSNIAEHDEDEYLDEGTVYEGVLTAGALRDALQDLLPDEIVWMYQNGHPHMHAKVEVEYNDEDSEYEMNLYPIDGEIEELADDLGYCDACDLTDEEMMFIGW